jgi:hypothetical protein
MDPFSDDLLELTGSLISMEFGPGGRITQLWCTDPSLPEEGEEFQFVAPPLIFGEESAEDYYPGTILLGARTDPDEPWMLSRNTSAQVIEPPASTPYQGEKVSFEYEFPLLPEISAQGSFYELAAVIPQILWDLRIANRGKRSIEIGELAFPLALNNFYDGFGWSDDHLRRLWTSRVYVHQFLGGSASWVFAQRMNAEPPGLLIFPGDQTAWEFWCHVPASLTTPHQWEGIPVVYVYSRAVVEREGWTGWANEHTSLILEPGDSREFQMRFVPADRDKQDGLHQTLLACGRPSIRLLPSAVAPVDVGIAVEVAGGAPTEFHSSDDAVLEVDSDEEGGFCFVRPKEPGPVRLSITDLQGRTSHVHLMFTEPLETLIRSRAEWIAKNQVERNRLSPLDSAILLTNIQTGRRVTDREEYSGASGIECSLADALFLAEKNTIFPNREEIQILNDYIARFLLDDIQNPGDYSVASVLADSKLGGTYSGRPLTYPHVWNLYRSMYMIAKSYGETDEKPITYLQRAANTAQAMFRFGWRHYVRTVGLLGYARIYDLLDDLLSEGLLAERNELLPLVESKAQQLCRMSYPYAGESVLDTSGLEDVFCAARFLQNDEHLERTMRCAYAARSLSPSWWWYGSDKRCWDGADSTPFRALADRGESCLAHTTIPNSLLFFHSLDRDYLAVPEAYMRLAFGGMLGPWALVRSDGGASMCFTPDLASKHRGFNPYTGSSGLGYYHYLVGAASYVLPNRNLGLFAFGCHFETDDDTMLIRPWDGVGRRIVLRQIGAEFRLTFGRFIEVRMDYRKRNVQMKIENPCDKAVESKLTISGLWGQRLQWQGKVIEAQRGVFTVRLRLPASSTVAMEGSVVS